MTFRINIFFLLALFSLIFLFAQNRSRLQIGYKAPDFTLRDASGYSHSLSDYEDSFVVLEWVHHDCPYVKKHYDTENMQRLQEHYKDKGVIWLSIIFPEPDKYGNLTAEQIRAITREKRAKPHAVLIDVDRKAARAYEVKVIPQVFVIAPQGILAYRGAIDNDPSLNPENIKNGINYIREALNNLIDGKNVETTTIPPYGCDVIY